MKPRKKLIEVSIPLEAINVASAREKSIRHGHPSTLHLWWARRPLAACRAVLFAQLVDDPSSWPERFDNDEAKIELERRRLHKVIESMVTWEASNDEAILNSTRWEIARSVAWGLGEEPPSADNGAAILTYLQTKAPPIYDPFSGGGSIPLEAQRLGLRSYGSDVNPVAVLIGKALVEIPPVFSGSPPINPTARAEAVNGEVRPWKAAQGLAADVRYYGQWMRDEAEARIGHLYPKATLPDGSKATVIAWLWARTIRSPDPAAKGAMVPLVSSFLLSAKEGNKSWVNVVIDPEETSGYRFNVNTSRITETQAAILKKGTKTSHGANFSCVLTGSAIPPDYIKAEGTAGRMGARMIAMVAEGHRSRTYLSPQSDHIQAAETPSPDTYSLDAPLSRHPQYMGCVPYGIDTISKLFTPRQFLALATFSDSIESVRQKVLVDAEAVSWGEDSRRLNDGGVGAIAYADAIATYLACAISRCADFWCTIATWSWQPKNELVVHAFGRQAIPMTWDFGEINPFSTSNGNFLDNTVFVSKVLERACPASGIGSISNADAAKQIFPISPTVISTDPPYYDNIPYADLSDFFYAWLRRSIGSVWPDLFRRVVTPKHEELVADMKRHGGRQEAYDFFMSGMGKALSAVGEASTSQEPVAIYYAFKQTEAADDGTSSAGWGSFLQAVVDARLAIDGTWPIRTERVGRMRGNASNALASSIVLVCRKRPTDAPIATRADFIRALKREMPVAIGVIRKAGVGPVDMQQSIIGPGMGVFSRHARVLEDDDSPMGVKTALGLINRVWEEIENELDNAFDAETQVALAWFATYGFEARPSGELITLANAKDTPSSKLFASGVFRDLRGKTALTRREELPSDWSPATDATLTVWECVQHTARVLNAADGGGQAAARLVAQMGTKAEEARALAYRLFEIATNKGWASEALAYNELAQEWTSLEDIAASLDSAGRRPNVTQSAFTFEKSQ